MPASPASSQLPEGKRGFGGGEVRGGGGGVSSSSGIRSASESGATEAIRGGGSGGGGGGGGLRRRDDLSSASEVPSSELCDVGPGRRGAGSGIDSLAAGLGSNSSSVAGYNSEPPPGSGSAVSYPTGVMDASRLQQQLVEYTDSLFTEGLLDEQFTQLQMLQDESNPDFVSEVVSLFFDDSEKLLEQLAESLKVEPINFKKVDSHVHQFKGSSSSIGAQRVKSACVVFRQCCDEENMQGCRQALVQVKQEFSLVKSKLEAMLALEQQLLAAGGSLPYME